MTTIKLKNGSGAPTAGDLVQGEPALDLTNKRLYTEDSGGTVIEVGTNPTSVTTGAITGSGDLAINTDTLFVDVSADAVGIGTSSPSSKLHLSGDGDSASKLTVQRTGATTGTATLGYNYVGSFSNNEFKFYSNSTERMVIDSSGNVGIGTTAPSGVRTKIKGLSEATSLATSATSAALFIEPYSGSTWGLGIGSISGQIQYIQGVSAAGDASRNLAIQPYGGNVGIGTSSPSKLLHVKDTNATLNYIVADIGNSLISSGNGAGFAVYELGSKVASLSYERDGTGTFDYNAQRHVFNNNADTTEYMRIDSSGNLLVGKTANDNSTAGGSIRAGESSFVSGDSRALTIVRTTNDGSLAEFRKAGTTVGSISTVANNIAIGKDDTALYISAATDSLTPTTLTSGVPVERDGGIDIGRSSARFRNIYGSGKLIVNGPKASYTDAQTVFRASSQNDSQASFAISVTANGLSSYFGGNFELDGTTYTQPNNGRSSGFFTIDNGTTASTTSALTYTGFAKGSTTPVERMRIDGSGNLLIGASAQTFGERLYVEANGAGANTAYFNFTSSDDRAVIISRHAWSTGTTSRVHVVFLNDANSEIGSISATGTTTSYNTSSDQRLKENIVDAPSASDDIDAIQVRSFDWKATGSHQKYGMVAQELQTVVPEAVSAPEDPEKMMGVDYSKLVPMLVKEIQSLRARVAQLETN